MSFTLHRGLAVLALLGCSLPAAAQQPCFNPPSLNPPAPPPVNTTVPGATRSLTWENNGQPGCAGADRSADDGLPGYPGQPGGVSTLNAPSAAITTGTGNFGVTADGGDGGAGGWALAPLVGRKYAGEGGNGGKASRAVLTFSGSTRSGQQLVAFAIGGQGGDGGGVGRSDGNMFAGDAGAGGAGGAATLDATGTGPWAGTAVASGGAGGAGGEAEFGAQDTTGGDGGGGGTAGTASLTAGAGGGSTTAFMLQAFAIGGEGGKGGYAGAFISSEAGNGGAGGNGGAASLTIGRGVSVAGIAIPLQPGLLVQSDGGVGGAGGDAGAAIGAGGGGGFGGNGGSSTATINGTVTTSGDYAPGALVQSIGGGGGGGGNATGIFVNGGAGLTGGDGGAVSINAATGNVTVSGDGAAALLGQSIGGGGGNGGNALTISAGAVTGVAIGGNGGLGGDGGAVAFRLTGGLYTSAGTAGGAGLLAQSIGGAGGAGGNAGSKGASAFQLAIGGDAEGGGKAGTVSVANGGIVTTFGDHAAGIEAQSIGGGGGKGGSALTFGVSGFPISVAVGGRGGGGGPANTAGVSNAMQVVTYGPDAPGVRTQSIGGGGGHGGTAIATAIGLSPDPEVPGVTLTVAVGGKGGAGNTGNAATITNSGFVATSGHGSAALMSQSIGGGGGAGGDSTAAAYTAGDGSTNISVSLAIGGKGGTGGTGGAVTVDNKGLLVSLGQSAYGVFGQSVGGGGGSGGGGDASASSVKGDTLSFAASLSVGGTGGSGGNAGTVKISNAGGVATSGDGADGLFGQSVGGGGGDGGGGVGKSNGGNLSISVGVGGSGGAGGNGGTAQVGNTGGIVTVGTDAIGLTAQSVGGGGGRGGKGGATAGGAAKNTDQTLANTITGGLNLGQRTQDLGNGVVKVGNGMLNGITATSQLSKIAGGEAKAAGQDGKSTSIKIGVAIGGSGGAAGTGGTARVTNAGAIRTLGALSDGMLAQSVGGGGGIGGAASASTAGGGETTGALGLGGSGGAGGGGGAVTASGAAGSSIATSGVSAIGMIAQSIGGGGGRGSVSAAQTGALQHMKLSMGGASGTSGNGGGVAVTSAGALATTGKHAVGILAQSIGGGGGLARVLSTDQAGSQGGNPGNAAPDDFEIDLGFGRDGAGGGSGGSVQVTATSAIRTAGRNAHGIVAQSIGGGGGMAIGGTAPGEQYFFGGSGGAGGGGGTVTVAAGTGGSVATTGNGAIGIWAQSIGGGGGIGGDIAAVAMQAGANDGSGGGSGDGAAVVVSLAGSNVRTAGANAAAIYAQSIGGGGGHVTATPENVVVTGSAGGQGAGGNVTVTLTSGLVAARGAGSSGILAQSDGQTSGSIAISLDRASSVTGGTGATAAAIHLMGGTANTITNSGRIAGGAGGSAGYAILTDSGASNTTVTNTGTISGGLSFGGKGSVVDNRPGGTIVLGGVDLGKGGRLRNAGTLIVTPGRTSPTDGIGDLHNTRSGRLVIDIDTDNGAADLIALEGLARLEGKLVVNPISLARSTHTVMTAESGLDVRKGFGAVSMQVFTFTPLIADGSVALAIDADFADGAEGTSRRSVASYLQRVWDGGYAGFGTGFADLAGVSAGDYGPALDTISGRGLGVVGLGRFDAGQRLARTGFSCQAFAGASLTLVEQDCGWMRVMGADGDSDQNGSQPGYGLRSTTTALGGQRKFAPGWFLGGAIGYEASRLNADGNRTRVDGDAVVANVTLKRQPGPWLFAGALDFGYGWYNSSRRDELGAGGNAEASPRAWNAGLHLRGSWQRDFERWYLQPGLELDASYIRMDGFTESGAGVYDLRVASSDGVVLAATPVLKLGSRMDLEGGTVLHLWSSAGVSFYDGNDFDVDARLAGVSGAGSFRTSLAGPDVVGRISAGVDVMTEGRVNVRVEAQAGTGSDWHDYGGQFRIEYRF